MSGLANGAYKLGVYVRSNDTGGPNYISLSGCGSSTKTTYVPVDSDGNWLHIVDYVYVSTNKCTINLYSSSAANAWTNYDDVTFTAGSAPVAIRGGDTSSLYRGEQLGGVYYDSSGTKQNALHILKNAGMNYARLKVWVNPADGYNDKTHVLAMAKRIKAAGMKLLVDFHYSDTWADPGKQTKPGRLDRPLLQSAEDRRLSTHLRQSSTPSVPGHPGRTWSRSATRSTAACCGPRAPRPTGRSSPAWSTPGYSAVKAVSSGTRVALHLANAGDDATVAGGSTTPRRTASITT